MLRNYNKRFYYKLCYYYYYYVYVNPRFQGGNPRFSDPRFHVGNPRLNQPQILRWQPQIVQPQIFHCQPQTQKIFRASRGSGVTQIIQYAPGTPRFIEELQSRPEIYNCAHPDYHTKRQEKLAELGAIFSMTGLTIPILYIPGNS